jgi:membrane protease YdiL (CAAX protease family)
LPLAAVIALLCLALFAGTGRLAFLRQEFPSLWRRVAAGTILTGTLTAAVFYPVTGGSLQDRGVEGLWFPGLFLGHALLVAFLAAWWAIRPARPAFMSMLPRLDHLREDLRYGLQTGLTGWLITLAVTMSAAAVAMRLGVTAGAPQEVPAVVTWLAGLPLSKKLLIIAAAMTAEEAFFRGFLQRRIGLIPSSILFTLAHAGYGLPFMMISILTISLLIGRALQQRGRLLPCVVAHGVFDAIQLLVVLPWAVHIMQTAA